jgi:uncharacterized Zn finger protein (UPF0148 family)
VAAEPNSCPNCGSLLPDGATECPACGAVLTTEPAAAPSSAAIGGSDLTRRVARLQQWAEAAEPLDVTLPSLPAWAEEAARSSAASEPWLEVVRGVERLAQKRIVSALEAWEKQIRLRLARLEAYAVDGRVERDQIEDVLHAARSGEITQALQTYHQVDRVVALKERHLDQAREELERLVSLLRDMQALGLPTSLDPTTVSEELERELRAGRLAALKQQLRALRLQAVTRLRVGVPEFVTRYGEFLIRERNDGTPVELEAAELARAAREFSKGRPEEALRRLRILAQVHGNVVNPTARASPPAGAPRESSRTA